MLSSSQGGKLPAVVLGGVGGSLSVVRSLSRHGVRVHVLADTSSLVSASRHCHEFVDLGSGGNMQDRWREAAGRIGAARRSRLRG